ncbi:hypothetical protein [Aquabacterium sp.]|uniref:hypothetical protein n=1 Tax=Aquabacterium sp. TaxID=1872578 RepID=UPI0035AF4501
MDVAYSSIFVRDRTVNRSHDSPTTPDLPLGNSGANLATGGTSNGVVQGVFRSHAQILGAQLNHQFRFNYQHAASAVIKEKGRFGGSFLSMRSRSGHAARDIDSNSFGNIPPCGRGIGIEAGPQASARQREHVATGRQTSIRNVAFLASPS